MAIMDEVVNEYVIVTVCAKLSLLTTGNSLVH